LPLHTELNLTSLEDDPDVEFWFESEAVIHQCLAARGQQVPSQKLTL